MAESNDMGSQAGWSESLGRLAEYLAQDGQR
jgi:hypothetical protein